MSDELRTLKRYKRADAAQLLNIPEHWLRDWVSQDLVPHQRKGTTRGVWFTWEDIVSTGRALPTLMTSRQGNRRAEAQDPDSRDADAEEARTPDRDPRVRLAAPSSTEGCDAEELLDRFAALRSSRVS